MHETAIVWFRRDLRLADNPALDWAAAHARVVVPIAFEFQKRVYGTASRAWRASSLAALDRSLQARGSRLIRAPGTADPDMAEVASGCRATIVVAGRDWDPVAMAEESTVHEALSGLGVAFEVFESAYAIPPTALSTKSSTPYSVFSPYFRTWEASLIPEPPLEAPRVLPAPRDWPTNAIWEPRTDGAIDAAWVPGEEGAGVRLGHFIDDALAAYDETRDLPGVEGTSRLSPHLAHGEITPRQILSAIETAGVDRQLTRPFVRQLAWREFAAHVFHYNPTLESAPLRAEFAAMPWDDDDLALGRWRDGQTGYPMVDAGMRELAATGWMHNRARLVAGSFLTKDLLLRWQDGEVHFWDTLVDADPAQNAFNWQWVAGCGADAAPYFRVFNPGLQRRRFDPDGDYVDRWISDGAAYPEPIVDHAEARKRALLAYDAIKPTRT